MIPNYDKLLSFVKESPKTFFVVGGTCAILIFFSDKIGTEIVRDTLNPILKVIFIICILGISYTTGDIIVKYVKTKREVAVRRKNSEKRINNLTDYEKFILSGYINEGIRSKSLDSNDGSVVEPARAGIIFQSTKYMDMGSHCKYNITDWAWEYLQSNPDVIKSEIT
jgi:hypothetical protein